MRIGIIGNGRFGDLLYRTFKKHWKDAGVQMYSRSEKPDGEKFFPIETVVSANIIIPCVPISAFEAQIKSISPMLQNGSLLIDVCSVNAHPASVMKQYIPKTVGLLSTHPMFGPDSTKNGTVFKGLKFIHYNVRITDHKLRDVFIHFWEKLGCKMIEMKPDEHDRQAAYTHAFAFLIGKIGIALKVRKNRISTKGFERLLYNQKAVENDTCQLFEDMMRYNPYAKQMRQEFKRAFEHIETSFT